MRIILLTILVVFDSLLRISGKEKLGERHFFSRGWRNWRKGGQLHYFVGGIDLFGSPNGGESEIEIAKKGSYPSFIHPVKIEQFVKNFTNLGD